MARGGASNYHTACVTVCVGTWLGVCMRRVSPSVAVGGEASGP